MSPNMFSVTITSNSHGARTRRSAVASTYMQSAARSGWRAATSRKMLRKNAIDGSTLALSTHVTRPGLPLARRCLGQPEGELAQPFGDAAADAHRVQDDVGTVATAHLARREQTLRRFADQDAVDSRRPLIGQRRRDAGQHPDRPHAGIELETVAEVEVRRHFGAIGIAHVGQSHGAEQDGIGGFGPGQSRRRQGLTRRPIELGARCEGGEVEREPSDPLGDRLEQGDAWLHHFDADPVAGEDRYLKLAHTHP